MSFPNSSRPINMVFKLNIEQHILRDLSRAKQTTMCLLTTGRQPGGFSKKSYGKMQQQNGCDSDNLGQGIVQSLLLCAVPRGRRNQQEIKRRK